QSVRGGASSDLAGHYLLDREFQQFSCVLPQAANDVALGHHPDHSSILANYRSRADPIPVEHLDDRRDRLLRCYGDDTVTFVLQNSRNPSLHDWSPGLRLDNTPIAQNYTGPRVLLRTDRSLRVLPERPLFRFASRDQHIQASLNQGRRGLSPR